MWRTLSKILLSFIHLLLFVKPSETAPPNLLLFKRHIRFLACHWLPNRQRIIKEILYFYMQLLFPLSFVLIAYDFSMLAWGWGGGAYLRRIFPISRKNAADFVENEGRKARCTRFLPWPTEQAKRAPADLFRTSRKRARTIPAKTLPMSWREAQEAPSCPPEPVGIVPEPLFEIDAPAELPHFLGAPAGADGAGDF